MAGNSGAIKAGKAYVEIYGDQTPLMSAMKSLPKGLLAASAGLGAVGGTIGGLIANGITSAFSAVTSFASSLGDTAGRLNDMADRTGVGVSALAELDFAATKGGTSLETLEGGLRKMSANLADAAAGSKTAKAAFDKIGVSVTKLSSMSPDEQFELIAEGLAGIANPGERAAAAMDIFGKSGAELLPLMKDGAKGVRDFRQEARNLGAISGKTVETLDRLGDLTDSITFAFSNAGSTIAAAFGPQLETAGWAAISLAQGLSQTAQSVAPIVTGFANAAHELLNFGTVADIVKSMGIEIQETYGPLGDALVSVATYAGGEWSKMFEILGGGWQGFIDGIVAGDLPAAFEVQAATLNLVWQQALASLGIDWVEWGALIQDTFNQFTGNIKTAWIDWTSSLGMFWNDLMASIQDAFDYVFGAFLTAMNWVEEKLGIIDAAEAAATQARIDGTVESNVGDRNAANEAANRKIRDEQQAQRNAVQQQRDARTAEIRKGAEENSAAKQLADARARFDAATRTASDKRAAVEAAKPVDPATAMRQTAIAGSSAMMATSAGAISFGGAAAGMAASQGPMNKLVSSSEETAANTKRLVDKLEAERMG